MENAAKKELEDLNPKNIEIINGLGEYYQLNTKGEKVAQLEYTHIFHAESNIHNIRRFDILKVLKNGYKTEKVSYGSEMSEYKGKWGLINKDSSPLITAKYDFIDLFRSEEYFKIIEGDITFDIDEECGHIMLGGKCGIIDKNDNVRVKPQYTWIEEIHYNLFAVNQGGKIYYQELESIKCWRAKGGKWGVIDKNGQIITPLIWDSIKINNFGYTHNICVQNGSEEFKQTENHYVFNLDGTSK